MAEIELVGDWSNDDATAVIAAIRKSLGVDDGGGAEVTVEETIMPDLAEKNRKKLLELWHQAGSAAFPKLKKTASVYTFDVEAFYEELGHECGPDCDHSWNDYGNLQKAVLGQIKRDSKGRTYRFNANNRWAKFEVGGGGELPEATEFTFPVTDGEFDRGVYLPVVGTSSGYLRLKLRLNIEPGEIISDTDFYELEDDMARNIGLLLDAKNVKSIAKAEGNKVTLLMVRDSDDIQVLGAISGSGEMPDTDDLEYHLVSLEVQDDHALCEVEVSPVGESGLSLQKSLRTVKKLWSGDLSSMRAVPNGKPELDRQLVRQAVANCDRCGVPMGVVKLRLAEGAPDWLPPDTYAFCLPTEDTIFLCNHDPREAIDRQVRWVTLQLMEAAAADAINPQEAMEIVGRAASVTPCEWLESLIKHYTGAILCARMQCVMSEDYPGAWHRYLSLLAGRGLEYWGNRHSIAKCMAEDYRICHDPHGLPNQVTMLWDQANPAISRVCQQVLITTLNNVDADDSD